MGPVKFDSLGENTAGKTLDFQWQNGIAGAVAARPAPPGSHPPIYPKPAWKG